MSQIFPEISSLCSHVLENRHMREAWLLLLLFCCVVYFKIQSQLKCGGIEIIDRQFMITLKCYSQEKYAARSWAVLWQIPKVQQE